MSELKTALNDRTEITQSEWLAEAARRFGPDPMTWLFVCPSCGHKASLKDWNDLGAPQGEWAYSCVGRRMDKATRIFEKPGPCNYAGGGLFALNPVHVKHDDGTVTRVFNFAPATEPPGGSA